MDQIGAIGVYLTRFHIAEQQLVPLAGLERVRGAADALLLLREVLICRGSRSGSS